MEKSASTSFNFSPFTVPPSIHHLRFTIHDAMATSRIDTFKQMLESDPDNALVRFGLANEYLKAEQYDEAIAALVDYLQRADDEGAAFGMLARAYEKSGQRERARETYLRGIEAAQLHSHPSMAEDYRMTLQTDYED
jgi:predicted Zn-dependent protease